MTLDAQINFRGSSGYVTDSAGQTYCLGESYPTVRGGLTFGWTTAITGALDRASGSPNAPEFSGLNYFTNASGGREFRLDLPAAGDYDVRLAVGDPVSAQDGQYLSLRDGAGGSALATVLSNVSAGADTYRDATGVQRSDPDDWRTNNVVVSVTTSGSALAVRIGDNTSGGGVGNSLITHLRVASAAGGSSYDESIALASTSDLAVAATLSALASADLPTASGLTLASTWSGTGSIALAGTSGLATSGTLAALGSADLASTSSLAAGSTWSGTGSADLAATAALLVSLGSSYTASIGLDAASGLTLAAVLDATGSIALAGASDLTAAVVADLVGSLDLAGTADLTAGSTLAAVGVIGLAGSAALTVAGNLAILATVSLEATGTLVVVAAGDEGTGPTYFTAELATAGDWASTDLTSHTAAPDEPTDWEGTDLDEA